MSGKTDVNRRTVLGTMAAGVAGAAAFAGTASGHSTNDPIWTTTDVNLRDGPGLDYNVKRTVADYTGLQIRDGPWDNDGYTWWYVRADGDEYNSGRASGYLVQKYTNHTTYWHPMYGELVSDHDDSRSHGDHDAIDIANDVGTPVYSAKAGTLYNKHQDKGCGKYVKIYHDDGWSSLYCHLDEHHYVDDGTYVSRGTQVGTCGYSGNADSDLPHLHFQIKDGDGHPVEWPTTKYVDVWAYTGISGNF